MLSSSRPPGAEFASRSRAPSDDRISRSVSPASRSLSTRETSASALSAICPGDLDEDRAHRAALQRQHEQQSLAREPHELESLEDDLVEPRPDGHPELLREHRQALRRAPQNRLDRRAAAGSQLLGQPIALASWRSGATRISESTYRRYAMSVGTRPADVCGWKRYPFSSRSLIVLRIVAGDTPSPKRREIVRDPAGSAVST